MKPEINHQMAARFFVTKNMHFRLLLYCEEVYKQQFLPLFLSFDSLNEENKCIVRYDEYVLHQIVPALDNELIKQ